MNIFKSVSDQLMNFVVLFFLIIFILKYVFSSVGSFRLMSRRKMKLRFLAFIPIINSTYVLGNISDSINKNYFFETKSRYLLLMLKIIYSCSVFVLFNVFMTKFPDFNYKLTGFILGDVRAIDFLRIFYSSAVASYVLNFTLVVSIIYLIYLFKVYYNIFSEYGGRFDKLITMTSVFSYVFFKLFFVPDFFIFMLCNKTSRFEKLNEVKARG